MYVGFPLIDNETFTKKYSRNKIMNEMLNSMLSSYYEKDLFSVK